MGDSTVAQWRPAPWFLLNPPSAKPGILARSRLSDLLDSLTAASPITLLLAPAGFGKSTILADWFRERHSPAAWLTATGGDEGPRQFALTLLSALCRAAEKWEDLAGFLHVLPSPHDLDRMLDRMLAALGDVERAVTVVIDDAQLLSGDVASHVVATLTEHSPAIRFVLAGTQGLDQWFGAELTSGQAVLVGSDTLALTVGEIRELARQMGVGSVPDVTESVFESTRGWPVAVRLALAVGAEDPASVTPGISADDILSTYISGSILRRMPPDVADFVLAATTSSRLTTRLAQMLTGREDAGVLLEDCVRRGLFLDRYQGRDGLTIYRWHEVFARHCRTLLARTDEPRVRHLNRLAAEAMAPHYPAKATVHAMRAQDPGLALEILRGSWIRLLVEGEVSVLNARCLALPSTWQGPEVLLIRACCLSTLGDEAGASVLAARARALLCEEPMDDPDTRLVDAFAGLFLAHDHAELSRAADHVAEALRGVGPTGYLDMHAQFVLGWTELRLRRDPGTAVRLLVSARRDAEAVGAKTLARRAGLNLMFALTLGGRFNAVRTLGEELEAAALADPEGASQHYEGGIEFVARGMAAYWRNDLAEAERQQRVLITQGGSPVSYTALARVHFALTAAATGDARLIAEARGHMAEVGDEDQHGVAWPAYKALGAASLAAASGERARALALCEPLLHIETIPMTRVLAAEIYRKGGRPQPALESLRGIGRLERVSYVNASALVTTATIMSERGDRARAHRLLERALDVAADEGISRPFVADPEDDALRGLLTEHAAWGSAHEGFLALQIAHSESGVSREDILGTALSPREREIFGYLCTTMTADEIAGALFVSVNTVRTHQRAIYRKLGVGSRREAIKRYRA